MATDMKADAGDRGERWLKVSIGLLRFELGMMPLVQQLGKLDVRLIEADAVWTPRFVNEKLSEEDSASLHEHITLSYLWVLGAYEFVRTLCQRVEDDDPKTPAAVRNKITDVRNRFERVRVPLAKMEKSRRFRDVDGAVAYPGMRRGFGVAWRLNENTWISRRELSDALLEVLEARRAAFLDWRAQHRD